MHVVVAGFGWLGTALARTLRARGDQVTGVRRSAAAAGALRALGVTPLIADLAEAGIAERIPSGVDAVIVCPSAGGGDESNYRRAYVEVNRRLLEARGRLRFSSYVYTSSTGVFGQSDGSEVDETTAPEPADPVATILLEAESVVLAAAAAGAPASVVRLSGLYGPEREWAVAGVRAGTFALGPGDDRWMNWCHREDAVGVIVAAIDRGRPGAVYHGTDALPVRKKEVVEWIASRLGVAPPRRSQAPEGRRGRTNRRVLGGRTRDELSISLVYPTYREGLAPLLSPSAESR